MAITQNNQFCLGVLFCLGIVGSLAFPGVASTAWVPGPDMHVPRAAHTATLLLDGTVLISGSSAGYPWDRAETYDPATGLFSVAANLVQPRLAHRIVKLPDGNILVIGGDYDGAGHNTASTETFDFASQVFSAADAMTVARSAHTATVLANGCVFVTGGRYLPYWSQTNIILRSTELNCRYAPPPPECSVSVRTPSLWPPNHKLVDVGLSIRVSDDSDPDPDVAIAITSDETTSANPGDPCEDAVLGDDGSLRLRAERLGYEDGRVYQISVTVTNRYGKQCTSSATVEVRHDADRPATDSGQKYDATRCPK